VRDGGEMTPGRANLREEGLSDGRREPGDGHDLDARDAGHGARAASQVWCCEGASDWTRGTGRNGSSRSKRGVITAHCRAIWASHAARGGRVEVAACPAGGSIHHCSSRQVPGSALARASVED
jgi:hypothetical protein